MKWWNVNLTQTWSEFLCCQAPNAAVCCDSDTLPPAVQQPGPGLCVTSSCWSPRGNGDAPSTNHAGKQLVSGKTGQSEWCQFGRAAWNTEQGFQGEPNLKLQSLWVYNRKQCALLYLQELALQEAANYMSHLNLFIQLRQSTFQSHAQNVSKIVPGQKCKCIRFPFRADQNQVPHRDHS